MNREDEKGVIELAKFEAFAIKARIGLIAGTAVKTRPEEGKPDIYCMLDEGPVYFEMTEACAPEFAAAQNRALDQEDPPAIWGDDVSRLTVKKKLKKKYSVSEPIELVLYTDSRTALADDIISARVKPSLMHGLGPFRRVWLYGDKVHELANISS